MIAHLRPVMRDLAAHLLFATGLSTADRRGRERLSVATFHRVLPAPQRAEYPLRGLVVTPSQLDWFLAFFGRHYSCGTLRDVAERWLAGERPARPFLAITFDDAQLDNALHAAPALERAGIKATFFAPVDAVEHDQALWHDQLGFAVARLCESRDGAASRLLQRLEPPAAEPTTGRSGRETPLETARRAVGQAKRMAPEQRAEWVKAAEALTGGDARPGWDHMASWQDLRRLHAAGHEVGSHSWSHDLLTQCSDEALAHEIAGSRARIEERLDAPVLSFCYPNGDCDSRTVAAVTDADYRYAVTTAWGSNAVGADLHTLRRCDMTTEHVLSARGVPSAARLAWRMSGLYPGLPRS